MDETEIPGSIERKTFADTSVFLSATQYWDQQRKGRSLSHSKARAFHGVIWTEDCPDLWELTEGWRRTSRGQFRISDPDRFDLELWELMGLGAIGVPFNRPARDVTSRAPSP